MSTLRFEPYRMPSAVMGRPSPLPDLQPMVEGKSTVIVDEATVPRDYLQYMDYMRVSGALPYTIQCNYSRRLKARAWRAVILENEHLRAVFLPELGGKLWSLTDLDAGRELLNVNPDFQPCNIALRNAWTSGGVEWNVGMRGHSPFTCERMFTETLALEDGTPVLRMYQYERIRGLVFRVEACLPDGSRQLYVRVRIDNASDAPTAVYWWSNMAVDEAEGMRVLVSTDMALHRSYGHWLSRVRIPMVHPTKDAPEWIDMSRTTRLPQAMDFFFDMPTGARPWIAAIDAGGYGVVQTSTRALIGRKLFVWGMGKGGRNWQRFLAPSGRPYVELQSGISRTQMEHLPMAPGQTISWMETYGALNADPALAQGDDWALARSEVECRLDVLCPEDGLERFHRDFASQLDGRDGRRAMTGSGWAHVQRKLLGEGFHDAGLRFPCDEKAAELKPWLSLIDAGALPCPDPLEPPASYQTGEEWERLLQSSVDAGASDHWFGWYHLGVMRAHRGDCDGARAAFETSLLRARNPWALYGEARVRELSGKGEDASEPLLEAVRMLPQRNLAVAAMTALNQARRFRESTDVYAALPGETRRLGRARLLYAQALLGLGDARAARRVLLGRLELSDIREGETLPSDLWLQMCVKLRVQGECPPPARLDFRMF